MLGALASTVSIQGSGVNGWVSGGLLSLLHLTTFLQTFAPHPCNSDLYWFGEKNDSFWVHTNVFTEMENKTATWSLGDPHVLHPTGKEEDCSPGRVIDSDYQQPIVLLLKNEGSEDNTQNSGFSGVVS